MGATTLPDVRDMALAEISTEAADGIIGRILPGAQPVPVASFSSSI